MMSRIFKTNYGFKIYDYILKPILGGRFSPFIMEWFLTFLRWVWVGPLLFLFVVLTGLDEDETIIDGIIIFFVYFPLGSLVIFLLLMPTPRREFEDILFLRRLRKRKKVMIGSVETFRTTFDFDKYGDFDPVSDIYELGKESELIFPLKFFCAELPEGHIPRSSAPEYDFSYAALFDPEEEPELAVMERNDPRFLNFASNEADLKRWKIRPKLALSETGIDALIALQKKEPSMEFEVEYLFFSKLLTGIYPIEGYDYPEGVTELLTKLNHSVNPWIKK